MPTHTVEMKVVIDDENPKVCGVGCDFTHHEVVGARCLRYALLEKLGNAEPHRLKRLRNEWCIKEFG